MKTFSFFSGEVAASQVWTADSCRFQIAQMLDSLNALPGAPSPLLIKGDFASGDIGPGAQSTDLRVLVSLIEVLKARGYTDIMIGDALPAGRTDIFPLLRLDRIAVQFGVQLCDLSSGRMQSVHLESGAFEVCTEALERHIILVSSLSVDGTFGLRAGMASLIGFIKTDQHPALVADPVGNLLALYKRLNPRMLLTDCLVVHEGIEPDKDLQALRFSHILASRDALLLDLFLARIFGMTAEEVPILWKAVESGLINGETFDELEREVRIVRSLNKPLRPFNDGRAISKALSVRERLKAPKVRLRLEAPRVEIRPVDSLNNLRRYNHLCGDCHRCESFCPVSLTREEIGGEAPSTQCMNCLYCYMVCPNDALSLEGEMGPLAEVFRAKKRLWESL